MWEIIGSKKDSTPGIDQITYSMITKLPLNGIMILKDIFNKIVRCGSQIPEDWKTCIVSLIPKAGRSPERIISTHRDEVLRW